MSGSGRRQPACCPLSRPGESLRCLALAAGSRRDGVLAGAAVRWRCQTDDHLGCGLYRAFVRFLADQGLRLGQSSASGERRRPGDLEEDVPVTQHADDLAGPHDG